MPYNGSGVFNRLYSWVADNAAGLPTSPVKFDADGSDVATALSNCVTRDGQGVPTADLPFNSHSLTGIRKAAAAGEPLEFAQAAVYAGQNLLHNASFMVNQRAVSGTVVLAAGAYGHDRWKAGVGGCSYTFATTGADTTITVLTGSLVQNIPSVDIDAGAYVLTNQGTAQARIFQGTPSGSFAACPLAPTSINAATAVGIEFGSGTILRPVFTFGSSARPWVRRPAFEEFRLCQSYYELFCIAASLYQPTGTGSVLKGSVNFKVTKYSTPTITEIGTNSGINWLLIGKDYAHGALITSTSQVNPILFLTAAASCEP